MERVSAAEELQRALVAVRKRSEREIRVGLVLGSGLGEVAACAEDAVALDFGEVPGLPDSTVPGHSGRLILGELEGVATGILAGRVHLYEGHAPHRVVMGVRLLRRLGAETIVVTNAAGGCGQGLDPGDLMAITDHLNLTGQNCLVGPENISPPDEGPQFLDLSHAYDPKLIELASRKAERAAFELKRGVYAGLTGPSYETPAEVRMLRALGADAVGMSTVLEVIAARAMGARVLGLCCITNYAAGLGEGPLSHREVTETAARVRDRFKALVLGIVSGCCSSARLGPR